MQNGTELKTVSGPLVYLVYTHKLTPRQCGKLIRDGKLVLLSGNLELVAADKEEARKARIMAQFNSMILLIDRIKEAKKEQEATGSTKKLFRLCKNSIPKIRMPKNR